MNFEWRDGKPYLVFYDYLSDTPKRTESGFPVTWAEAPLPESNQPAYRTSIDDVYQVANVRFNVGNPAVFYVETDVPQPKVRRTTELRWRYGWQKLTRQGWQPT